jgi:hypothetical protein
MGQLDELLDEIYQDKNTLGDLPLDRDLAKDRLKELFLGLVYEADGSTVKYGDLLPEIRKRIKLL